MAQPSRAYDVEATPNALKALRNIQILASQTETGDFLLEAIKHLYRRLQSEPTLLGEPLFRLKVIRAQVRVCFEEPLVAHFAVFEERPLVFLTAVEVMSRYKW